MTASKNPKLRFKEFKDDWEGYTFEDIYYFKRVFNFSRDQLSENEGKIYNIHYGDIHTRYNSILDISKVQIPKIKNTDLTKFNEDDFCKNGDLIIADASEDYKDIGKSIELFNVDCKITAGLHTFLARPKIPLYSGISYLLMKSKNTRNQIMKISTGTSVLGISKSNLSKISIYLPEINEQQKIAYFLILVDNYIQILKSQKEELEKYKKAVMQKIFSQQIRFKDDNGKDFPNWSNINFENFLIPTSERNTLNKISLVLSVNNKRGFIKQSEQFEDREVASKDKKNYKIVYRNEYAYNPARINIGSIARLSNYESGIVSPMYSCFKLNNIILPEYFDLIIKTKEFSDFVESSVSGSVRKTLNFEDLIKYNLFIPDLKEQKAIANFFNSINLYAHYLSTKNEILENWKKGLMQQMFI